MGTLLCFGLGYTARALVRALDPAAWTVTASERETFADATRLVARATHVLVSIPPDAEGDPTLRLHGEALASAKQIEWLGYLSTTGVYGDTEGALVDEGAALVPNSERSRQRVKAEFAWQDLASAHALPLHIFRLAGIYGPGRSALDQVRAGKARRVVKEGHAFSRIHVDDIARVLLASIAQPNPGAIYNVCDDEAAEQADVVAEACRLLGVAPPPPVPFEEAIKDMSPMAQSFWQDNRRIDNARIKSELGVEFAYPSYREGLRAILEADRAAPRASG
jgi:nucleoside-diphosphate-sugar epimerase